MDLHHPEADLDACYLENPSQVSLPDLEFSEQSQEALQLPSEGPAPGPQSVTVKPESANAASTFDVLKLPVLSTSRAKSSTKGKWSIEERHSECPIKLKAFLKWMTHTEGLDTVGTTATAYPVCYDKSYMLSRAPTVLHRRRASVITDANYVIPWKLLQRVNTALIKDAQARDMKEDYELVGNDPEDEVAAAYVVAEMGGFSRLVMRLF
ncbi:hypothetical protein DVH05_005268 [Phytophthora capsici]|nr:hypothetical protein DVH05_005268 [Phytophthora capsici]